MPPPTHCLESLADIVYFYFSTFYSVEGSWWFLEMSFN